ncbi:MAG TPA: hypothetical protein VMT53_21090 [Terriglobales bacterium]|nr:hypothetical protein [Terriglobales bacterium]
MCRGGDCSLTTTVSGPAVLTVLAVTFDSVLGDCLSDDTVQQGEADNGPLAAAANSKLPSLPQHGWQLSIAGPVQATTSAGDRPITHMRANPTSLRLKAITTV